MFKTTLYGLKKALRAWYTCFATFKKWVSLSVKRIPTYINIGGILLIIVLYINDLSLTRVDNLIQDCKADLAREFEMKDIWLMHYFLELGYSRVMGRYC